MDENGSVWEATPQGLRHWQPRHNPFELGLNGRYPPEIFALKKIRNPLEHAGQLWVASEEGLFRAALNGTKVEKMLPQGFHALLADDPVLWAASKEQGLFRIEMATRATRHYPAAPAGRGPSSNTQFVMARDAWGRIWLGGHLVFDCFDPRSEIFSQPRGPQKNPNSSILSLHFDRQNRLWVGTYSEGLFVYFFDNQGNITNSEQFRYDAKLPTSISNDIVLAIWQDPRGDLWFGTDGGLNRLAADWQSGQPAPFRRYLRSDGLADDKIMSIRDDAAGNLWVAHLSHGLSRLTPSTGAVRTFGTADGLPSPLLYWTSAFQRPDRVLLFGTTEGLAAFHPDSLIAKNTVAPPVYFTDIQLFNEKIEVGGKGALLPESPIFEPSLNLSHAQNSLTFRFAALNFTHPESNRYAYRLVPLDQDWRALGSRHEVSFSHLPPGRYTLRVKACNNDGVWNETGASLAFRIRPPWWQTPWAYALYAVSLGGGLWLFFRQQIRAAKRKFWQHFGRTLAATDAGKLSKGASGAEIEFLQTLYNVLEEHLADEYFSVEQMARLLSLSRTQLHRKVIEATGFSAGQLLQNQRLGRAQQLLAETNLSIAEVAFRCGFSDPNYFSRLFSKTQGLTPSEFAQQVRA
jgi:ligand-binding sensor domain-containing protein/AraC-like DNA-binding protein